MSDSFLVASTLFSLSLPLHSACPFDFLTTSFVVCVRRVVSASFLSFIVPTDTNSHCHLLATVLASEDTPMEYEPVVHAIRSLSVSNDLSVRKSRSSLCLN